MGVLINMVHSFGSKINGMDKRLTALDTELRCVKGIVTSTPSRSSNRASLSSPVTPVTTPPALEHGSKAKQDLNPDPRSVRLVEEATTEKSELRVSRV